MTRMMKQLNHFAHKMSKKEHLHHIISNIWTDACSIKTVNTAATTHIVKKAAWHECCLLHKSQLCDYFSL